MPTRTEAAEALYRAAQGVAAEITRPISAAQFSLLLAIDGVKTATPDPLPAEVQRVLEAALDFRRHLPGGEAKSADGYCVARDIFAAAVAAYRSTQPEPLSARLARLRPGSEVATELVPRFTVLANCPERRCLFADAACFDFPRSVPYHDVTAILSESP